MKSEYKKILWAWAFTEAINIICFTTLAIVFKKWWIVLFAALFTNSVKASEKPDKEDA